MYNNYAMGHLPLMIEPLTELEQLGKLGIKLLNNLANVIADTLYDFNLNKTETNTAMNMAISPCQACYTLNSSPRRCGKYLFCDILCQVDRVVLYSYLLKGVCGIYLTCFILSFLWLK
jgi:hypothetical protein